MSILHKKRQKLHSQIRSQYIQNFMKKTRYQFIQNHNILNNQHINNLIEQTSTCITHQQLAEIVHWANNADHNNAIIHLGNLLIDGVIGLEQLLVDCQLTPRSSRYWLWLVKVIISLPQRSSKQQQLTYTLTNPSSSQSAVTTLQANHKLPIPTNHHLLSSKQHLLNYTLNRFITQQQTFSLIECLEIIQFIIKKYKQQIIKTLLNNYQAVILKVKQTCFHFERKVSQLSFEIVDQIIECGDDCTVEMGKVCSLSEIQRVIILGFNKLDPSQKKFPLIVCRIVNNILATKIQLSQNILKICINSSMNSKNTERTIIQFSYLWLTFCETCTSQSLKQALDENLLDVFRNYLSFNFNTIEVSSNSKAYKNFIKVFNNITQSLRIIQLKMAAWNNMDGFLKKKQVLRAFIDQIGFIQSQMKENKLNQEISFGITNNTQQKDSEENIEVYQTDNDQNSNGINTKQCVDTTVTFYGESMDLE